MGRFPIPRHLVGGVDEVPVSRTLGAQARQSNATPHIHSSHLACGYAYTPPAKLPGEGGLSLHRSSESWRAGKCDRPCESDGTSDAVASSARTCVEAASQPRDDGTRPSGQHRDLPRFEGMLNQSADVVSDCYTSCSKSIFWSLRSTTSNRGGALNGWIEEVGGGKLGAPRDRFHLWAKPSWRQSRIHQRTSTLRQESNSKPQSGGNRKAERDALLNTPDYRVFLRRQQRLR